jgi:hypothetical protein
VFQCVPKCVSTSVSKLCVSVSVVARTGICCVSQINVPHTHTHTHTHTHKHTHTHTHHREDRAVSSYVAAVCNKFVPAEERALRFLDGDRHRNSEKSVPLCIHYIKSL